MTLSYRDAHFHPYDLEALGPWRDEFIKLGTRACANCHTRQEYEFNLGLKELGLCIDLSFGIHPQLPLCDEFPFLEGLAASGKIVAIGECGFDLFGQVYRLSETAQEEAFALQLELALKRGLCLLIHARRASHKIFAHAPRLKGLRAIVFHSWAGTPKEAAALLERGCNAYFSFGGETLRGRRSSMESLISLPADRILAETDAPFQGPPGMGSGHCACGHIKDIVEGLARLRGIGQDGLGDFAERLRVNYSRAYGLEGMGD